MLEWGLVATGFWAQFMWSMGLVHSENVFAAGALDSAMRADAFDLLQRRLYELVAAQRDEDVAES